MTKNDLRFIEGQIGYKFKNIDLLQQAFVRRSYAKENGGEDNEVLEFIGDKVLDFAVVRLLAKKFGKLCSEIPNNDYEFNEYVCEFNEGKLTTLKASLVNKVMLASRTEDLGIAKYLIMGKGDTKNTVEKEQSVKEDLFEAILGAVAIDSKWNIDEIQSTVDIMLCPEHYLSREEENYVALIQKWCLRKYNEIPWYHYDNTSMEATWHNYFDGPSTHAEPDTKFYCLLKLGDMPVFRGFGKSKSEARKNVCEYAYKYLEDKGLLFSIKDEIKNPNKDEAISQLEILARRGYFSIAEYNFSSDYDKNGNPIWTCVCSIEELKKSFKSKFSSKKEAKKSSAYKMLNYILADKE